ncbi:MAG: AmmeMemoRadiSam system protein A [Acidiferrobacterales bacterium]
MSDTLGATLLILARNAIAIALDEACRTYQETPQLSKPAATFVTLTRHGELRGCIGSLEARRALHADVQDNARAAAFHDPRFAPLTRREYPDTEIEISLLSATEPLSAASEQQARAMLRPGIDGIVLEFDHRRSTFLPQVWEQLPEPGEFLVHLKHKAGLPADFWHDSMRLSRYTVQKWHDTAAHSGGTGL